MIFEFVEQDLRSVIKQMNASVVQGGKNPRPVLVEGKTLDTLALGLKFCVHHLLLTYACAFTSSKEFVRVLI